MRGDERPGEVAAVVKNCRLDSNMGALLDRWGAAKSRRTVHGKTPGERQDHEPGAGGHSREGAEAFRSGRVLPRADRAGRTVDQG